MYSSLICVSTQRTSDCSVSFISAYICSPFFLHSAICSYNICIRPTASTEGRIPLTMTHMFTETSLWWPWEIHKTGNLTQNGGSSVLSLAGPVGWVRDKYYLSHGIPLSLYRPHWPHQHGKTAAFQWLMPMHYNEARLQYVQLCLLFLQWLLAIHVCSILSHLISLGDADQFRLPFPPFQCHMLSAALPWPGTIAT